MNRIGRPGPVDDPHAVFHQLPRHLRAEYGRRMRGTLVVKWRDLGRTWSRLWRTMHRGAGQ